MDRLNSLLNRQLTDQRISEAILNSADLTVEFESVVVPEGAQPFLRFTIYSNDTGDGRSFIFGEGSQQEIWTVIRNHLEKQNL